MKAQIIIIATAAATLLAATAHARSRGPGSSYRVVDGNRIIGGINYGPQTTIANGARPRSGIYPGGCVPPALRAKQALRSLRSLNRSAFLAERQGVMTRPARFELTKQAATIYKAVKNPAGALSSNGVRQLALLGRLTRHARTADGGRVDKVGLRSFVLHGQQVRFATSRGVVGTSKSFLKAMMGVPESPTRFAKGVKTISDLGGNRVQLVTLRPASGTR